MSQHDFNIANQTASAFRADLNSALKALASLSSGPSAPTTTYANMLWYDTGANLLKMRTEADDGWITIAYLNQGAGAFSILDDTQVVNTSGTQTGLIGDQATATWEAGTGTTPSLVSPASVKAAIDASISTTFNTVGTYGLFQTASTYSSGSTASGSVLDPSGSNDFYKETGTTVSGTWRCMGHSQAGFSGSDVTVWVRIS